MGIRKWQWPQIEKEKLDSLIKETESSSIIAKILLNRGHENSLEANYFEEDCVIHNPFEMKDMDIASHTIMNSVEEGELIAIYGDYDCDGITATTILFSYLQDIGARVLYYIPDRDKEGYGLNNSAIDKLKNVGVSLIVTVDNGISAINEADYVVEQGMRLIITDHHQPRKSLPNALAVLNPHRLDDTYPFKNLSGVGVAFKLICAMEGDIECAEMLLNYGSLLAIGTVADVVGLTGENREFVKRGLESIQNHENLGINSLLEVGGSSGRNIDSSTIAFGLAPRLNAAGRVGKAQRAVELLLSDNDEDAISLAEEINDYNEERKKLVDHILKEIEEKIASNAELLRQRVLVICGENWHHGVTGIAASKMVERYGKPCILISIEENGARGSARSVEGYSIIGAITRCSTYLTRFGGHNQAAGLSLNNSDVDAFIQELQEDARKNFDIMPVDKLKIDAILTTQELSINSVEDLKILEPCGCGNETPIVAFTNCKIELVTPLSEGKHIRIRFLEEGKIFYAIYFGMCDKEFPYKAGDTVDIAANVDINEYNGERSVSIKVKDIRLSSIKQDKLIIGRQYYEKYLRHEPLTEKIRQYITPEREDIAILYRYFKREQSFSYGYDVLWCRIKSLNYCKMMICIDIMNELGLLNILSGTWNPILELPLQSKKVDLNASTILKRLKAGDD